MAWMAATEVTVERPSKVARYSVLVDLLVSPVGALAAKPARARAEAATKEDYESEGLSNRRV